MKNKQKREREMLSSQYFYNKSLVSCYKLLLIAKKIILVMDSNRKQEAT